MKFGNELKHELPTAEVGLDPSGGGHIGSGCHRYRSLHSGIGSASRRMGARRTGLGPPWDASDDLKKSDRAFIPSKHLVPFRQSDIARLHEQLGSWLDY